VPTPPHIFGFELVTVMVGLGLTVTTSVCVLLHPPVVPVTEYVVVTVGLAVTDAPVDAFKLEEGLQV